MGRLGGGGAGAGDRRSRHAHRRPGGHPSIADRRRGQSSSTAPTPPRASSSSPRPWPPAPSSPRPSSGGTTLQASAYGAESRFGLRPPIGYLLACAGTWLLTMSALVLAPPALAGRAWVLGIACLAIAAGGLATLPRRWHQLSRRWFVLVPAGLVVHDPVVLLDTLMLPRRSVAVGRPPRSATSTRRRSPSPI